MGWVCRGLSQTDNAVHPFDGAWAFLALELVADRVTKAPFAPDRKLFLKIRAEAMANGLICYPVGGNVDGVAWDIVILAPAYNASDAGRETDRFGGEAKG